MNKLLFTLALAGFLAFSAPVASALTTEDTVQIIAGFMDGVILKDNLKEIRDCMTDVERVTTELEDIFKNFESMSIYGIFEGIKEIIHMASELRGDFK